MSNPLTPEQVFLHLQKRKRSPDDQHYCFIEPEAEKRKAWFTELSNRLDACRDIGYWSRSLRDASLEVRWYPDSGSQRVTVYGSFQEAAESQFTEVCFCSPVMEKPDGAGSDS
jgi:hypothetical protein